MISITGEKAIDDLLRNLPQAVTHSILGSAHFAAAKPLIEKEKQLVPTGDTDNLIDSIGAYKLSLKKATEVGEVRVGPRRKGGYKGFAGHLVNFGTRKRSTRKGANRGVMPATHFAERAFESTKGEVERSIAVNIGKSVIRTMRRYIK